MEPTLHHRHPLRFITIIGFVAMILISTERAGQSEMVRIAAEQTALYMAERAPAALSPQIPEVAPTPLAPAAEIEIDEALVQAQVPSVVRGVYLTGWSAGNEKTVERILALSQESAINAVIVDIKDATGRLSYQPLDEALRESGVGTNRISDLPGLASKLHEAGIYLIGRVAVFQDPFYAQLHPEDAFLDTRTGLVWKDYKGISWLMPNRQSVWQYHVAIARDAHAQGFDEINLDYVRFPSDGPLAYLDVSTQTMSRAETMESFFAFIGPELRTQGIVVSADLFGLTMSASDDLGIGQKLEAIAPHVDFIAPMIYPSHFASGSYGIAQPAHEPYKIISKSLSRGIAKLEAIGEPKEKLRPWLQDFNLGAIYTENMVRDQIRASEELGITSWMLWDPRNIYTSAALIDREPQPIEISPGGVH